MQHDKRYRKTRRKRSTPKSSVQCNKADYPSAYNAKKAMKIINNNTRYIAGVETKKIKGWYECTICFNFHLTSKK